MAIDFTLPSEIVELRDRVRAFDAYRSEGSGRRATGLDLLF